MKLLKKTIHSSINEIEGKALFTRSAARAICIKGDQILLVYTKKYNDYALPGGGICETETKEEGLIRELTEETGAKNIRAIKAFGCYEEYRPWHKAGHDIQHIISYCYICEVNPELGKTSYEDYEINNGMKAMWISISDAISHNEETIKANDESGLSIERETFLLKHILKELI
ncbi:MAG: ADP-ribose pyrophosphatase YjhB (NUDIX family) [Thermoproteota archaeon]|jgi:ADP-ribose pyrophosphatase YjhB (NUDIX family)